MVVAIAIALLGGHCHVILEGVAQVRKAYCIVQEPMQGLVLRGVQL